MALSHTDGKPKMTLSRTDGKPKITLSHTDGKPKNHGGEGWTLLFISSNDLMMDWFNPKHVAKAYQRDYTLCFDWWLILFSFIETIVLVQPCFVIKYVYIKRAKHFHRRRWKWVNRTHWRNNYHCIKKHTVPTIPTFTMTTNTEANIHTCWNWPWRAYLFSWKTMLSRNSNNIMSRSSNNIKILIKQHAKSKF